MWEEGGTGGGQLRNVKSVFFSTYFNGNSGLTCLICLCPCGPQDLLQMKEELEESCKKKDELLRDAQRALAGTGRAQCTMGREVPSPTGISS